MTIAPSVPNSGPRKRSMTEATECASPLRSASGFIVENISARFGSAAAEAESWDSKGHHRPLVRSSRSFVPAGRTLVV